MPGERIKNLPPQVWYADYPSNNKKAIVGEIIQQTKIKSASGAKKGFD